MKRLQLAFLVLACLFLALPAQAAHWYQGGTLHEASAGEWLAGSDADRLATMADWILDTSDEAQAKQAGGPAVKRAAILLVGRVTEAAKRVESAASVLPLVRACMGEAKAEYAFLLTAPDADLVLTPEPPAGPPSYRAVVAGSVPGERLSIDCVIDRAVNADTLAELAREVHAKHNGKGYKSVFIMWYLPHYKVGAGAWGVTNCVGGKWTVNIQALQG